MTLLEIYQERNNKQLKFYADLLNEVTELVAHINSSGEKCEIVKNSFPVISIQTKVCGVPGGRYITLDVQSCYFLEYNNGRIHEAVINRDIMREYIVDWFVNSYIPC